MLSRNGTPRGNNEVLMRGIFIPKKVLAPKKKVLRFFENVCSRNIRLMIIGANIPRNRNRLGSIRNK